MKRHFLPILMVIALFAEGVSAQPQAGPGKDSDLKSPVIVLKDAKASPVTAPNDGTARVGLKCTVFSTRPDTRIISVWADLSHTFLGSAVRFSPSPRSFVPTSLEGSYEAVFGVPLFMDAGTYRVPVFARDSAGNLGRGWASFTVAFRRGASMPFVGSGAFYRGLAAFCGKTFTPGNRVEVLDSGKTALERRLALLKNARRQINLECYTFDQGLARGRFMDYLLARAGAGVEVNVILNADTQVSTSPLSTLRLSTHELLGSLVRDGKKAAESDPLFKGLLASMQAGNAHVLVPSGRDIAAKKPVRPAGHAPDHWLTRASFKAADAKAASPVPAPIRSRYQGPGGLPALPLLDYAIHEKILVVDGKSAIVGGRNLEDRYFSHWLDQDLYLEGPVVEEIRKGFCGTYESMRPAEEPVHNPASLASGPPYGDGLPVMFVQSAPWNRDYGALKALVYSIAGCRKSFLAYSQYLALSESLLKDAIVDAARRGVNVEIITNSAETSRETSFATGYFISLNNMGEFLEAGVKIHEMRPAANLKAPQPYMHVKEFLFDGQLAASGSFNLSLRSSYIESENLVFVADSNFAAGREALFRERVKTLTRPVTRKRYADLCAAHKTRMEAARLVTLLF